MRVYVRFFASARERAQRGETERELDDGATVGDLWEDLCAAFPALAELTTSISFAVNREYAQRPRPLADGDEVALIPPVSGGA